MLPRVAVTYLEQELALQIRLALTLRMGKQNFHDVICCGKLRDGCRTKDRTSRVYGALARCLEHALTYLLWAVCSFGACVHLAPGRS